MTTKFSSFFWYSRTALVFKKQIEGSYQPKSNNKWHNICCITNLAWSSRKTFRLLCQNAITFFLSYKINLNISPQNNFSTLKKKMNLKFNKDMGMRQGRCYYVLQHICPYFCKFPFLQMQSYFFLYLEVEALI